MTGYTQNRRAIMVPIPRPLLLVETHWAEPISDWVAALRAAGRAETTIRTRTEHLRWLARDLPTTEPWDITLDDLNRWCGTHAWARETRRSVRASLRSFYGWGHASGRCSRNTAADLSPIGPAQPRPHPAPDAAYAAALAAADERERLILRLAAEVGLRRGEVACIHTRDLVQDLTGWSLVVHGKGARDRVIPLPPGIAGQLRALPRGYAFPGDYGPGHLSPRWVGKLITRLLPDGWTMHSLRHRFATRAYAVDRDLLTVGRLLGHASPVTTRVYVQIPDESLRRTVLAAA